MMSLSRSELKKGSLYRQHQLDVQNALKCYGISSEMEHAVSRFGVYGCKHHPKLEFTEPYEIDSHLEKFSARECNTYQKYYLLDNFVLELKLDIESDGKAHSPKGQRARDEKRDAYLESLGIHVLRFTTKQDPVEIAKAVSLMKKFKELKA